MNYTKQKVMGGSIVNLVFVTMTYKTGLIYIGGSRSMVDPHWFHCGSRSGSIILGQCKLGSGSRDSMTKNCKIFLLKKIHIFYIKNCKICIPIHAWSHRADYRQSKMSSLSYLIHEKPESIDVSLPAVTVGLLYWNTFSFHPSMEKENVKKTKNLAVVGTGTVTERRVMERLTDRLIDTSNDYK